MTSSDGVTVLVVGDTGVGKSENGNAFLQKRLLEANSKPESCTFETSAQYNIVNGIKRYYIDTQGLQSVDRLDSKNIQQMVSFLKNWNKGVNAFFIVINIQCPRFDQSIQKLLKIINEFFNNPNLWNQTGIIFTKCYEGRFNRKTGEIEYRRMLINFIKTLPGCRNINPQMPCFFVDSKSWQTDKSTNFEYLRMFEYAHKNPPVPTQKFQAVKSEYKKVDPIYKNRVFIESKIVGCGPYAKKINYFQDQKIMKYTDWNNKETYSSPIVIKSYTEEITAKTDEETKVDVQEFKKEEFKTVKVGKAHWWKHRKKVQVHDYYKITTKYITSKRTNIIDVNDKTHYGEWKVVDISEETRIE